MNQICCRRETSLSAEEKGMLQEHLTGCGLSENVWDFFDELITISTPQARFFYIKAYSEEGLEGIGLFFKVKPYDLSTSNKKFRNNALLKRIISAVSTMSSNCVFFSFGFLTANLTRPFFFNGTRKKDQVMKSILSYIKQTGEADMIVIMDTSHNNSVYRDEMFEEYPAPSEAWINPTRYASIDEYLREHRSAKKHVSQKKDTVFSEITRGPVEQRDIDDMMECLKHSIDHSKMNTPFQKIFEENISESDLFSTDRYLYINIRIENKIVGFTNYIISGTNMAAVIGGYNRDYTQNNYLYERLFVKSLEYAIDNGITRLSYGMVDNFTKLRLTGSFDPTSLYFYSPNYFLRKVFDLTSKSNDMYELCLMEKEGLEKYCSRN